MAAVLELSKLEIVRRQLETAVRLYFTGGDEVSVHTLAAASYNVVRDTVRQKNLGKMIVKNLAVERAKPDMKEDVRRAFNAAENFFKHADKDPDATLKFLPAFTEYLIFDAEMMYQFMTGELPALFLAFRGWFVLSHQDCFNFSPEEMKLIKSVKGAPEELIKRGRREYLGEVLPLATIVARELGGAGV